MKKSSASPADLFSKMKSSSDNNNKKWRTMKKKKEAATNKMISKNKAAVVETTDDTPIMSNNRKKLPADNISTTNNKNNSSSYQAVTYTSTNLFLEMNDSEVGNHTDTTPVQQSNSADETHSTVDVSNSPSPDRVSIMNSHQKSDLMKKGSPRSVMDSSLGGSSTPSPRRLLRDDDDDDEKKKGNVSDTTTPPRDPRSKTKYSKQHQYSNYEKEEDEEEATNNDESIEDMTTTIIDTKLLLFGDMSIPSPLDKFHDFITGNICWSPTTNISDHGIGCVDTTNTTVGRCVDTNTDDSIDAIIDELDHYDETHDGGSNTTDDDDYDEEYEYEESSTDGSNTLEVSSYSSEDDDEEHVAHHHQHHRSNRVYKTKKKNVHVNTNEVHQSSSSKKPPMVQKTKTKVPPGKHVRKTTKTSTHHPRYQRRRGRSPTAKHGYNSDGESIRHSSHSRSSRGSYGSSLGSSSRRGGAASLSTGSLSTSRPPHHGNTAGATASGTSSKSPSSTHDARLFDKQVEQYKETSSTITSSSSVDTDLPSVMESVLSQDQAAWIAMTTTQTRPTTSVQAVRSKDSDENAVLLAGNYYDESPMVGEGDDDIEVYFKVRVFI